MRAEEARQLLGFPPNSRPNPSQVKAAYKKKVWDYHPDRFPSPEKPLAESQFKSRLTPSFSLVEDVVQVQVPQNQPQLQLEYSTEAAKPGRQ